MDAERPDYANYIASLGLNPTTATPWEQIVRSGGDRAGDTLQFMELPVVSAGRARARFLTSGVRHVPDGPLHLTTGIVTVSRSEHEAALESLSPGATVDFAPQIENPDDANATLVTLTAPSGTPLGWVPQSLTASIRELLEAAPIHARVAPGQWSRVSISPATGAGSGCACAGWIPVRPRGSMGVGAPAYARQGSEGSSR